MNLKIIGAAVATIVVVIGALVALIFTGIIPNPIIGLFLDEPEHSAQYYPGDTLAYGWLTLYPEGGSVTRCWTCGTGSTSYPGWKTR